MKYSFDKFGWYSSEEIPSRQTEVIPPMCGTPVVGQPYPNFTGYEWILLPYSDAKNYALVKNGVVENVIVASPSFVAELSGYDEILDADVRNIGMGWIKQGDVFVHPEPEIIPQPETEIHWTPLEFRLKFTSEERKSIRNMAKTNDDVFDLWDLFNSAEYINPKDPRTIQGFQALEMLGALSEGRANEILNS